MRGGGRVAPRPLPHQILPQNVALHGGVADQRLAVAAGARIVFMPNNEGGLPAEDKLEGYRAMQVSRATENMVSTSANICVRPQSGN